ncbi:MAG: prepilin-type N-terminal cleavage/methylation domain-containing protein [Luteimonas sp.]
MSAIHRRRNPRASGFTLLELVVVLALLSLATALVAPQGFRMIASWRRATETDAVLGALVALGAQAQQQGRVLKFDTGPVPANAIPGLPEGWTVVLSEPLTVQVNGACSGTRGELKSEGYVRGFALSAPFCRVAIDGQPDGGQ